jgi:hypothetical protein
MLENPSGSLEVALLFFGIVAERSVIDDAVAYCSFDKMRDREVARSSLIETSQTAPTTDDDTLKARRGGIGGYVQYLSAQECEEFEALTAQMLTPEYGYEALPAIRPPWRNAEAGG